MIIFSYLRRTGTADPLDDLERALALLSSSSSLCMYWPLPALGVARPGVEGRVFTDVEGRVFSDVDVQGRVFTPQEPPIANPLPQGLVFSDVDGRVFTDVEGRVFTDVEGCE